MNHRPVAIGLVLCEQIIVDEKTRNATPVNCFNVREVEAFPATVSFSVLAWLADGMGKVPVEIVVESLDTLDHVFRMKRVLDFANPLQEYRFVVRVRNCSFPVRGYYQVLLVVDGELLAHRKVLIQEEGAKK